MLSLYAAASYAILNIFSFITYFIVNIAKKVIKIIFNNISYIRYVNNLILIK